MELIISTLRNSLEVSFRNMSSKNGQQQIAAISWFSQLTIWTCLRSLNALAKPKSQILRLFGYN